MTKALALLLPLLVAAQAHAYSRSYVPTASGDGPCLFWRVRRIPFTLNQMGSASAGRSSLDAARASFQVWNEPSCSDLEFVEEPLTDSIEVGFDPEARDNTNLVVWREVSCDEVVPDGHPCLSEGGCNNLFGCWEQSPGTIAVTTTTFSTKTGELFDADIELNGARFVFSTVDLPLCNGTPDTVPPDCVATDIENTLVHEIGHVVGLDHVSDPEATMFLSAQFGETEKRSLEADDIQGLCDIYPVGRPTATCVNDSVAVQGRGCGCGSGPGTGLLFTPLLVLLLAGRRRGRA